MPRFVVAFPAWAVLIALLVAPAGASGPSAPDPVFSRLDTLFLTAATGEPRFAAARAAAESALRADTGLLPYLVANRLTGQTPRRQHYVERLFTLRADSGRSAEARVALAAALESPATSDTVRAQLLYVGSRIGDTAFRATAERWLESPAEPVRRMAVRSLGAYPAPGDASRRARLLDGVAELRGLELHQRLWALEANGTGKGSKGSSRGRADLAALVPLLDDSLAFNRRKVRDLLLKGTDSAWSRLEPLAARAPRRERLLLALDAKGGAAFLRREARAMTAEERAYFGME